MTMRIKFKTSPPPRSEAGVMIYGESGVGKTCFFDMLLHQQHYFYYSIEMSHRTTRKQLTVDNHAWILDMLDISSTIFRSEERIRDANTVYNVDLNAWIKHAQGVVLLFDLTSRPTYDLLTQQGYMHVISQRKTTDWNSVPYLAGQERFGGVLVGNKSDLASQRQVSHREASDWAQIQGMKYFEVDTKDLAALEEVMRALVRSVIRAKRRDEEDMKEVEERLERMDGKEKAKNMSMSVSSLGGAIRKVFRKQAS